MSIAALKKVSVCGLIAEKKAVLDALQSLGCMHLASWGRAPVCHRNSIKSENTWSE